MTTGRTTLADWIRNHAITLDTLDPGAPLDDLESLRKVVGDARVVALGESAHRVREFYLLRHRILRFLVERCGFTTYAFETPVIESYAADAWVGGGGGTGDVEQAATTSATNLAQCQEMHDTLAWMRGHAGRRRLRFAGVLPGAGGGSPIAELSEVADFLRGADPGALPLLDWAVTAAWTSDDASVPETLAAYAAAPRRERDTATTALHALKVRMETAGYQRTAAYAHLRNAWHLDRFHRDATGNGTGAGTAALDAAMAETVLRMLDEGGPETRILVGLHNVHIGRAGAAAGRHLADALGDRYVAIAATSSGGDTVRTRMQARRPSGYEFHRGALPPPADGSVEAAFPAQDAGAAVTFTDLREARSAVADADCYRRLRQEDDFADAPIFQTYDVIANIPRTTPTSGYNAEPSIADQGTPRRPRAGAGVGSGDG